MDLQTDVSVTRQELSKKPLLNLTASVAGRAHKIDLGSLLSCWSSVDLTFGLSLLVSCWAMIFLRGRKGILSCDYSSSSKRLLIKLTRCSFA